jgi:hypothetical protein
MATPRASGYSSKPLIQKLGYLPDQYVRCIDAPGWFINYLESEGVVTAPYTEPDWLHIFCTSVRQLSDICADIDSVNVKNGIWLSWPKKSSGVATDLTEQTFRDLILPHVWVDTKVCAIDETWSGLKFLRRKA